MSDPFIGTGWAFPGHLNDCGGVATVTGRCELEEAIRLILATVPGERPMRPEFGCGIHRYVFAPVDESTAGLLSHEVRTALQRWEPRIRVESVSVGFDAAHPGLLYLDIDYRPNNTNDVRNLVFPFYTIPEHGEALDQGATS